MKHIFYFDYDLTLSLVFKSDGIENLSIVGRIKMNGKKEKKYEDGGKEEEKKT